MGEDVHFQLNEYCKRASAFKIRQYCDTANNFVENPFTKALFARRSENMLPKVLFTEVFFTEVLITEVLTTQNY